MNARTVRLEKPPVETNCPVANVHVFIYVHEFANLTNYMNIRNMSGAAMERALAAKLEELLAGVGWLRRWRVERMNEGPDPGFDLLGTVPLPEGGKVALCVECKRELRPSLFRVLAQRHFTPPGRPRVTVPVLAMPRVSPRVAELCEEHGWCWFDAAGNCLIDIPGLLHIRQTGNEPVASAPRPAANLGTAAAGRVVRALLLPDHAGRRWTQRDMQMHCQPGVSLGLVNKVIRHLRDEGYVEDAEDRGFRLSDPLNLLFAWRDAYRFDRHERRGYFTLKKGKELRDALAALGLETGGAAAYAAYAAFTAADKQEPYVRQPKTWLYVRERDLARFEELTDAKPVDSGENMVVLIPDDEGVFYLGDGGELGDNRMSCTNAVQTFVDLYHCGGRGAEAAEALLNRQLKPEWQRRGLSA